MRNTVRSARFCLRRAVTAPTRNRLPVHFRAMVMWEGKIRAVPCPIARATQLHSRAPATAPAARTGHSERGTNGMSAGARPADLTGHATMSPMALRPKRWSSVRILQASCLFRFLFPHWAWRLPHAACLLVHVHLSCSFQARPPLLVRPWPQDRDRIHRDSTKHVLPESGRGARLRRGLKSGGR
jgi:hypothetical protein